MKLPNVRTSVPCDRCLAPAWGSGLIPFLPTAVVKAAIGVAPTGALLAFKARLSNAGTYLDGILRMVLDAVAEALSREKRERLKHERLKRQRTERALRERATGSKLEKSWEALIDDLVDEYRVDMDEVPPGALDWARA